MQSDREICNLNITLHEHKITTNTLSCFNVVPAFKEINLTISIVITLPSVKFLLMSICNLIDKSHQQIVHDRKKTPIHTYTHT